LCQKLSKSVDVGRSYSKL